MWTGKINNQCKPNSWITHYPSPVYESLLGIALTYKNLVVLENHCIIMRRDHNVMKGKVKIIAGGGAGTEPSEAFYVGKGMLTAAVVGGLFTAPSANEILLAIRELANESAEGILLLVKNYIGDRLNFTVAMEQALKENILVKMLIIQDHIFYHTPPRQGRHGMAGSVLVYKIAGEMAEQGLTLEKIVEMCEEYVLDELATASATLGMCSSISAHVLKTQIAPEEILLGVGVYGKGGSKKIKNSNLQEVLSVILQEIISFLNSRSKIIQNNITVLVNNLGATSKLEEIVIAREVATQLNRLGFKVAKLFVGTFMSSFVTQGFSVSILQMNSSEIIKYLNAQTAAPGWPGSCMEEVYKSQNSEFPITVPTSFSNELSKYEESKELLCSDTQIITLSEKAIKALKQITIFAAEALISCERQLNLIDSEVGDGDIGTILKRGAEALRKAVILDEMDLTKPAKFLYELSEICSKFMAGLSGILYCVFFRAAAKTFQNSEAFTYELCSTAFTEAVKALKYYGNAELGDRTMLDALTPAAETFEKALKGGRNIIEAVYLTAITCEFKSEETKSKNVDFLLPADAPQTLKYADAGAHATTIWLRAVSEGLKLHYPLEC